MGVGLGKLDDHGQQRQDPSGQEGIEFDVIVVQAPDAATAKAQEPAFKAQLEKTATDAGVPNMKLTELPNFEPGVDAAVLRGSSTSGTPFGGVALTP